MLLFFMYSQFYDKAVVVGRCRMTSLLQKFRISFSEVIEVTGINDKPSKERWALFENCIMQSTAEI